MKIVLIAAALGAAQFTASASANPDVKRRDIPVQFGDLDLSTAAGVAALELRLAKAVVKACGTAHHLEPQQVNDMERCRAAARYEAEVIRNTIVNRRVGGAKPGRAASK